MKKKKNEKNNSVQLKINKYNAHIMNMIYKYNTVFINKQIKLFFQ